MISSTTSKKKDEDFFDYFLDLFGFGSDEELSFENQTVTSEFSRRNLSNFINLLKKKQKFVNSLSVTPLSL